MKGKRRSPATRSTGSSSSSRTPTCRARDRLDLRDDRGSHSGMDIDRRSLLTALSALPLSPRLARAAAVTDGAGRSVAVPAKVERVFPAGPPAAIVLYTLAPELLLGWPRAN